VARRVCLLLYLYGSIYIYVCVCVMMMMMNFMNKSVFRRIIKRLQQTAREDLRVVWMCSVFNL